VSVDLAEWLAASGVNPLSRTTRLTVAGPIAAGGYVAPDREGRVVQAPPGLQVVGRALTGAEAAGQSIGVALILGVTAPSGTGDGRA
jgi:hypothetical protein